MNILLLEPDRVIAKCIKEELSKTGNNTRIVTTAHEAVEDADLCGPDVVISELSLAGHSGTEFIYEFRTYSDWEDIPLIVYSSIKPQKNITESYDWKILNIHEFLYKPTVSITELATLVAEVGLEKNSVLK